jgi:hypothetical protein
MASREVHAGGRTAGASLQIEASQSFPPTHDPSADSVKARDRVTADQLLTTVFVEEDQYTDDAEQIVYIDAAVMKRMDVLVRCTPAHVSSPSDCARC